MKTIRHAVIADKPKFRELWDLSFSDSLNFRNWFFENRFVPEYSIVMEEDGKIVSAVQSIPLFIGIRGQIVPATMMVGACTHPDYKRRGYMKELYSWYMNYAHKLGITVCAHTPAVLRTYFYVGHLPVSDTAFLEIENALPGPEAPLKDIDSAKQTAALLKCYSQKATSYSGIVKRSFSDMGLKMADYAADGGRCIGLWKNGELKGYAVYYLTDEMLHGEEIIALDAETEQRITDALIRRGAGLKVNIKLPPDTKVSVPQGTLTISPRNVMGLANLSLLLSTVINCPDYTVKINDGVVSENHGIFTLDGKPSGDNPLFETSAGNMVQWITGYKSIADLAAAGELKIYDPAGCDKLDQMFPRQVCHIIDEY